MSNDSHQLVVPELGLPEVPIRVSVWLVPVGQNVSEGERVVQLCAGEVTVDLAAPASGRLATKLAEEDAEVTVGQTIAQINGA